MNGCLDTVCYTYTTGTVLCTMSCILSNILHCNILVTLSFYVKLQAFIIVRVAPHTFAQKA